MDSYKKLIVALFLGLISFLYMKSIEPVSVYKTQNKEIIAWEQTGAFYQTKLGKFKIFYKDEKNESAERDETLVVIHGFPTSSLDFSYVLPSLSKIFKRVILFDHIGFGLSDKPDKGIFAYTITTYSDNLLELLEYLKVTKAHVLAHDLGDSVAAEILTRQHLNLLTKFEGLSYTFTNGGLLIEHSRFRLGQILLKSFVGEYMVPVLSQEFFFERTIRSISGKKYPIKSEDLFLMHEMISHNNGNFRLPSTINYLNDRYQYQNPRWIPSIQAASTKVKINLIWGDDDDVAPFIIAQKMKEICPKATLKVLKDIGHFYMLEAPSEFIRALNEIFKTKA